MMEDRKMNGQTAVATALFTTIENSKKNLFCFS